MTERELYVPIKNILIEKFESMGGKVFIENTSDGKFSRSLKEVLDIETINFLNVEGLRPDLTGYYEENDRKEIIIVEVKAKEITLMNISQAKTYANIFNAHHCFLISSERLGREKRTFIRSKGLMHRDYKENLVIAWYNHGTSENERDIIIEPEVLRDLYYQTLPKPFGVYATLEKPASASPKDEIISYITSMEMRKTAEEFIKEVENWEDVRVDPIKGAFSIKTGPYVFTYFYPQRTGFKIAGYLSEREWQVLISAYSPQDLPEALSKTKEAYENIRAQFFVVRLLDDES